MRPVRVDEGQRVHGDGRRLCPGRRSGVHDGFVESEHLDRVPGPLDVVLQQRVVTDVADIDLVGLLGGRTGSDCDVLPVAVVRTGQTNQVEQLARVVDGEDPGRVTTVVVHPPHAGLVATRHQPRRLGDLRCGDHTGVGDARRTAAHLVEQRLGDGASDSARCGSGRRRGRSCSAAGRRRVVTDRAAEPARRDGGDQRAPGDGSDQPALSDRRAAVRSARRRCPARPGRRPPVPCR